MKATAEYVVRYLQQFFFWYIYRIVLYNYYIRFFLLMPIKIGIIYINIFVLIVLITICGRVVQNVPKVIKKYLRSKYIKTGLFFFHYFGDNIRLDIKSLLKLFQVFKFVEITSGIGSKFDNCDVSPCKWTFLPEGANNSSFYIVRTSIIQQNKNM